VEVSKDLFGPEIDAAFAGITVGKLDNGDTLRPEEEDEGDDPEPDCDAAVGRDGRDDVQVEDGDDKEEDKIAASEGADEFGGGLCRRGQVCLISAAKAASERFGIAALKRCATQKQEPTELRSADSRGRLPPHEHCFPA
jgi:hypothetical protein